MKYFGRAPPICSLITPTAIWHSQRNSACYEILLSNFWKHKMIWAFYHLESEQSTVYIRWQVTGGVEILCRVRREEQKMPRYSNAACREEKKLARNSKKGEIEAKCGHLTPFIRDTRLTLLSFVGAFTSCSSFSLLSNSSPLFLFGVDFHFVLVNKWQRWEKEGQIGALKWMAVIILLIVGALVTTTLAGRVTIANQGGGDCQYSCKAIALAI